jgi:membrane-associated phospholipid phosphatase
MFDSISARTTLRPRFTDTRRPWVRAILFSLALSSMFVLVYGGCNAIASRRSDLGTCFFAWELRIPFVPALIVPYMSIDLLFVGSFLLCADQIELRAHARRIALAIMVAGLAFLVFPLETGYRRPEVSGWTGWLFEFLWSFDKPHNLVPSLHVALASLLWPVYARHGPRRGFRLGTGRLQVRGPARGFVHVWFALILVSPLLTWQHHLLDVATGAMLAQVCLFAFPERRLRSMRSLANPRVAGLFAGGSSALAFTAIALGAWFWLLLWPAASLALIASAYLRGNASVFRKSSEGRLPFSTRVVLGPYLCGTFARLLFYRRLGTPWVEAAPGVYFGRLLTGREAVAMRATGITGVLDVTAEHAETRAMLQIEHWTAAGGSPGGIAYLNIPVLDLNKPSPEQLEVAVAFMAAHSCYGGVYVHCALGISRSVAVVAAYIASLQTGQTPRLARFTITPGPRAPGDSILIAR